MVTPSTDLGPQDMGAEIEKLNRGISQALSSDIQREALFSGEITGEKLRTIMTFVSQNFIRDQLETNSLIVSLAIALEEVESMKRQLMSAKQERAALQAEIDEAQKEIEEERARELDIETSDERVQKEMDQAQQDLKERLQAIDQRLGQIDHQIQNIEQELADTESELDEINDRIEQTLEELRHLPRDAVFHQVDPETLDDPEMRQSIVDQLVPGTASEDEIQELRDTIEEHINDFRELVTDRDEGNFVDAFRDAMGFVDMAEEVQDAVDHNRSLIRQGEPLPQPTPQPENNASSQIREVLGLKEQLALLYAMREHTKKEIKAPRKDEEFDEEAFLGRRSSTPSPSAPPAEEVEPTLSTPSPVPQNYKLDVGDNLEQKVTPSAPTMKMQVQVKKAIMMHKVGQAFQNTTNLNKVKQNQGALENFLKDHSRLQEQRGHLSATHQELQSQIKELSNVRGDVTLAQKQLQQHKSQAQQGQSARR